MTRSYFPPQACATLAAFGTAALLSLATSASAQRPSGYLGKRAVVELGADFTPWELGESDEATYTSGGVGVSLTGAYVVGRRWALGGYVRVRGLEDNVRAFDRGFADEDDPRAQRDLTAVTFGTEAYWHWTGSGRIAPVGLFASLGVGYTALSGDDPVVVENPDADGARALLERFPDPVGGISVTAGFGYRYIYADAWTLTPVLRIDFAATGLEGPVDWSTGDFFQPGLRIGRLF